MNNVVEITVTAPAMPMIEVQDRLSLAETFVVSDEFTLEVASAEYTAARQQYDALDALRMKVKRPILDAGKELDALFKPALEKLETAAQRWSGKIGAHMQAEKRRHEQEAAKQREAARAEQERLTAEAAQREAAAHAEALRLRKQAQDETQAGNSGAASELVARADQAELAGAQDAQLLLEQVQQTIPLPVPAPHKPTGVAAVQDYPVEYIDLEATIAAVHAGTAPRNVLTWDRKVVQQMADALKDQFKLPGCNVLPTTRIRRK